MRSSLLVLALLGLCVMAAPAAALGDDELDPHFRESIVDLIDTKNGTEVLWEIVQAVLASGELDEYVDELTAGNFTATVFVPTNEAFAALPAASLSALEADPAALAEILKYHIVPGVALTLADVKTMDGAVVDTLLGGPAGQLKIRAPQGAKKAALLTTSGQDVRVYQYNMPAGKAIVHSITSVLVPGETFFAEAPAPAPAM